MPISWDAPMDRKLFYAILKVHKFTVDAGAVAELLSTDAQPCTATAVKRRLERIMASVKDGIADEPSTASPALKELSKSHKRRAASTPSETPTKKQKTGKMPKKQAESAGAQDETEEVEQEVSIKDEAE